MREQLGDAYRPSPLWRQKVWCGELGVSTGKGFYDYSQAVKEEKVWSVLNLMEHTYRFTG